MQCDTRTANQSMCFGWGYLDKKLKGFLLDCIPSPILTQHTGWNTELVF